MIAAIAHLDPRRLTPAERIGLEMVHDYELGANAGGYYGRPPHRITRQLATALIRNGLVSLDTSGAASKLALTGNGRMTYGVMIERRQQRRRA